MNFYVKIIFTVFSFSILFSKSPQFPNIESFRLDNGINILVLPDYRKPIVTYFINTGRNYKDIENINYDYLDNMIFSSNAIKCLSNFKKLGARYNLGDDLFYKEDPLMKEMGYSNDDFSVTSTLLKEDTKYSLELLFDYISETDHSGTQSKLIRTSSSIIAPFLKFTAFLIGRILDPIFPDKQDRKRLYIRHSEHIFSDRKSIRDPLFFSTSMRTKSKAIERIIHPENITLFISGDVNVLNIKKILNETFNKWENNSIPYSKKTFKKVINNSSGVALRFVHSKRSTDKKNSSILSIILRNPDEHSPKLNKYASQIAANVVLNRSENFKSYDNYEGYSNFFSDRWNTLRLEFSVSSNDTLLSEYNNICNEINRIANVVITQEELDHQKKNIEKNLKSIYSDTDQFSFFVTSHLNTGLTLEEIKEYWNNFNNVNLDEVNQAVKKLFELDNIYVIAVGDKKQSRSFINNFDNVELYNYKDKLK